VSRPLRSPHPSSTANQELHDGPDGEAWIGLFGDYVRFSRFSRDHAVHVQNQAEKDQWAA
jgi:hypothetical protein